MAEGIPAGQTRHISTALGGAIAVLALPAEKIEALQTIVIGLGIGPDYQLGIAGALLLGGSWFSIRNKRKAAAKIEAAKQESKA